ncbi:MAG: YeeE/YedE family protein [Pseudomonadota bacterium]|nr:YeeE/YedE family protein [Pseudomonadota bacterium]
MKPPPLLSALLSGLLFGAGLALSGMVNPAKVLNFFDVFGAWDGSLLFVMAGALAVTFAGYRFAGTLRAHAFPPPERQAIDARLLSGAALFGLGWGLSGLCPGPAITSLTTFSLEPVAFLVAMVTAMALTSFALKRRFSPRGQSHGRQA